MDSIPGAGQERLIATTEHVQPSRYDTSNWYSTAAIARRSAALSTLGGPLSRASQWPVLTRPKRHRASRANADRPRPAFAATPWQSSSSQAVHADRQRQPVCTGARTPPPHQPRGGAGQSLVCRHCGHRERRTQIARSGDIQPRARPPSTCSLRVPVADAQDRYLVSLLGGCWEPPRSAR